jgi:glycine cleavage system H protein
MRFTKDHEWVEVAGDVATIGITAYAVESVKAASDVFAPVSGEVVGANTGLSDTPETVNQSPEADGWFVKLKLANPAEVEGLMDRDAYEAFLATL